MKATGTFLTKTSLEQIRAEIFALQGNNGYTTAMHRGSDAQQLSAFRFYCNAVISMLDNNFHAGMSMVTRATNCLRSMSHEIASAYTIDVECAKIQEFLADLSFRLNDVISIGDMPTCRELEKVSALEAASMALDGKVGQVGGAIKAGIGIVKAIHDGDKIYDTVRFYNTVINDLRTDIATDCRQPCEIENILLCKCNEELDICTEAAVKTGLIGVKDSAKLIELAIKNNQ